MVGDRPPPPALPPLPRPPPRAIGFCVPLASLLKIGAPTSSPRKARAGGPREFCRQRRGRRGLRLRCAAESESGVGGLPPAGMDWGGTSSRGQETQGDCAENQTWNKNQVVPPPTLLLQRGGAGGEGGDIRFSRKADSRPAGSCVGSRDQDAGQLRGVAGARRGAGWPTARRPV